jgi:WD40 repeat protein
VVYAEYNVAQILSTADWQPHAELKGHAGQLTDAAWAPPGATSDHLATAGTDGTVRIWDAATGETVHVLRGHMGAVNDIDWNPDGTHIASASTDGTVRIWQADTGKSTQVLRGHTGSVSRVRWSPQLGSALLVSVRDYSSKNDHTRVWNAETGEQLAALIGGDSEVREAVWNATGVYLAAATDDNEVYLWRPGSWRLLPSAEGDAIAWSPDGAYLAADKPDNSIILWDAAAEAVVRQFIGHTGDVNTIDWDRSDSRRFISSGADGKVRHWSLDDSTATAVIDTDAGDNYGGATLSPDGRYVALWTGWAGVSLYPTQIQDLITIACQATVRNLGPADWQEFIAPQDPQAICEGKPIPGTDYPDPRTKTTKG